MIDLQFLNIEFVFSKLFVLNDLISKDNKFSHPENIEDISLTLITLKFDNFILVRELHSLNIEFISITFLVSK